LPVFSAFSCDLNKFGRGDVYNNILNDCEFPENLSDLDEIPCEIYTKCVTPVKSSVGKAVLFHGHK